MKKARNIAILTWLVVFGAVWTWAANTAKPGQPGEVQNLYGSLRSAFFTGFLTLAGFILALITNILLRLQKDLFDDPIYKQRVKNASSLAGKPYSRNEPVIKLGTFLIWTVLICLLASMVQITLGLVSADWAVSGCFATVWAAMVFILISWWAIRENLLRWFELLREKEKQDATAQPELQSP